jgi:predicted metal-dependent hydrolase
MHNYMEYTLIRARKRSLSLQINAEGKLVARAPLFMPKFLIDRFISEKSGWIKKRLAELKQPPAPQVEHFSETALKSYIVKEVTKYGRKMGLNHSGLRYTQVRTYWGTCAPSGLLSFNLALRYTPPKVVSYVVVHELAHLRWKGHGKRFWDMVMKYYPGTKEARAILRKIPRSLTLA